MTECKRCGKCCEVISLNFALEQIRNREIIPSEPYDGVFVLRNFVPLSPIDIWRIQPDRTLWPEKHYYKCLQFDGKARLCKKQKFKPPVCADYPFYPFYDSPTDADPYPGCAFWADLGGEPG